VTGERAVTPAARARRMTAPRWLGPLVGLVLRSPFHELASGSLLLLTIPGRRTGQPITLPLGYDQGPDGWYVIASEPERKNWWRNLSPDRAVTALIRGRRVEVRPELVRWSEANAQKFESDLARYLRRSPFVADGLGVTRLNEEFDTPSLRNAARRLLMVRLTPSPAEA